MSEFFLELFSEEIPAGLQKNLREKIFEDFKNLFEEKSIRSKKNFSFSTPNRLVLVFEGCLLYTSPSPRDKRQSRMPSSA